MPEGKPSQRKPKKSVTIRDVASHAGVSLRTVTNVINHWPYVSDQTRAKVQRSIDALGYRPSRLASSLVTGRTNTIGVMIPDITNPFFGQVVRGCEDVFYAAGYSIFLCNTNEDSRKQSSYLEILVDRGVDGLVIFGARSDPETPAGVVHAAIPVVAEDSPVPHENTTRIDIDNVGGAQMAVAHLIALGHARIAHLGGPTQRLAADHRLEGYRQALERAGLPYAEGLVQRCSPSIRGGLESALAVLETAQAGSRPSALFCYNDLMAVGAMVACRRLDLAVPRDVAVVGFDDIAIASLVEPALTTVRVQQYAMGRLASELLLARLAGRESPQESVQFPVELVVRNSCGARRLDAKQQDELLERLLRAELADLESCRPQEPSSGQGGAA